MRHPATSACLACLLCMLCAPAWAEASAQRLAVVVPTNASQMLHFAHALRDAVLTATTPQLRIVDAAEYVPEPSEVAVLMGSSLLQKISPANSTVICMATEPQALPANVQVVYATVPLATRLEWLRQQLPGLSNISIIYHRPEFETEIRTLDARFDNLNITGYRMAHPGDLPRTLKHALASADALVAIADNAVFRPETARAILLESFRRRVPLFGLSKSWVKAGALFGLEWSEAALIAACTDATLAALAHARIETPSPARTALTYSVNRRTADHLKLELAPELLAAAETVY